jgi:hypothetical protein
MRSTWAIVRGAPAAAAAVLLLSARASAQAPPPPAPHAATDKVAAEALFEEGRRLVAASNFADACPKFADSERLDPSPGTLLNLANCYEKLGRSASAWATYREAASAANAANRADYVATAQRHAEALAPTLARLTVTVPQAVDGLQVTRDGAPVGRGEWGVAIPIDAGTHKLEATAPGYKSWSSSVEVQQDGAQAAVTIPALEALPVEPTPPPLPTPAPGPPPPPVPVSEGNSGGGQRVVGLIIGGVGVVGLALGGAFALTAKSQYNTSLGSCQPNNPDLCNSTGVSQRNTARSDGNIASVAVGVGAAALVGGAVIWLTAPHGSVTVQRGGQPPSNAPHLAIAPTIGGALVQGAW